MSLQNSLTKAIFAVGFFSVWILSSAYAQNWVRVIDTPGGDPAYVDVDVDSILKGVDGLVYYDMQDDLGASSTAIDCQEQIFYVVVNGQADLKSRLYPVMARSESAKKEADFVCSRVS